VNDLIAALDGNTENVDLKEHGDKKEHEDKKEQDK
jgi:hypothetical protein